MISRRNLFTGAAAMAAYASIPRVARAANVNGTIPGAIRWDAWYGAGSGSEAFVNPAVSQTLGPAVFQARAPWFARPMSPFLNSIVGTQANMDAEISYAASAGMKYWAYCWYGQQTPASPMQNAWNLHQSSSVKNSMNWCMLLQFSRLSTAAMAANQSTYVAYFQQANYQAVTVATVVRPLLYIFMDTLSYSNFGGTSAAVTTAITNLRAAAVSAGVGTPYIVVMTGSATTGATLVSTFGADSISNYTGGTNNGVATPWTTFEPTVEAYWATMGATGTPIVPICMDGLDSRPRYYHPSGLISGKPNVGASGYVTAPTPTQLTAHLQAAVSYVVANPSQCPSKAILIYSWDECDEFGAIIPSYNAADLTAPITTTLNAVGGVTW